MRVFYIIVEKKKFQRMKQIVVVKNKLIFKYTNGKFEN